MELGAPGSHVHAELDAPSCQTQHKPLGMRKDTNIDYVLDKDGVEHDVPTDENDTISIDGDEDHPQLVQLATHL